MFKKLTLKLSSKAVKQNRALYITAFVFPFALLVGMAGINEYHLKTSRTLVLPVEGYDPRDLLSGRYLVYKINYGLKCPARPAGARGKIRAYMCFEPKKYITLFRKPENCSLFLKGHCRSKGEFYSGVDRWYLSEKKAQETERLFRSAGKKSVVLSVTKKGRALAKDLLIDEKSIKKPPHRLSQKTKK